MSQQLKSHHETEMKRWYDKLPLPSPYGRMISFETGQYEDYVRAMYMYHESALLALNTNDLDIKAIHEQESQHYKNRAERLESEINRRLKYIADSK